MKPVLMLALVIAFTGLVLFVLDNQESVPAFLDLDELHFVCGYGWSTNR